jgi:hypothetical protein
LLSTVESGRQIVQDGGGELPLERLSRGVAAVFEGCEAVLDLVQVGEVVGLEAILDAADSGGAL